MCFNNIIIIIVTIIIIIIIIIICYSVFIVFSCGISSKILATLSEDEDDGSENGGKKINLRSFKLNRVY